jgi:hypothetical protein
MDALTSDEAASFERIVIVTGRVGRRLLARIEAAGIESSVPVARSATVMRGRPFLEYHEHGEVLERGPLRAAGDAERFLARVDALQEQWRVIRGRFRVDPLG